MKQNFLPLIIVMAVLTSCGSTYKAGQTPDDVYYSPERLEQEDEVKEEKKKRQDDVAQNDDEAFLRMKVRNRTRWNEIDDFDYWTDSRFNFCNSTYSFNSNYYNNKLGAGNGSSWSNYYGGYYSGNYYNTNRNCGCSCNSGNYGFQNNYYWNSGNNWNWNNPTIIVRNYKTDLQRRQDGNMSNTNIAGYRNTTFGNSNSNTGNGKINNNNNSSGGLGQLLRTIFNGNSNSNGTSSNSSGTQSNDTKQGRGFELPASSSSSSGSSSSGSSSSGGGSGSSSSGSGSSSSGGRTGRGG
jgi:hypothetical protein